MKRSATWIWEQLALIVDPVTLNGKPARVSGLGKPKATVRADDGSESAMFTWRRVEIVVCNKLGRFTT